MGCSPLLRTSLSQRTSANQLEHQLCQADVFDAWQPCWQQWLMSIVGLRPRQVCCDFSGKRFIVYMACWNVNCFLVVNVTFFMAHLQMMRRPWKGLPCQSWTGSWNKKLPINMAQGQGTWYPRVLQEVWDEGPATQLTVGYWISGDQVKQKYRRRLGKVCDNFFGELSFNSACGSA